jgi:hypothetical protein
MLTEGEVLNRIEIKKRALVLALFYVVAIRPGFNRDIKSVHFQLAKIKQYFTKQKIRLLLMPIYNLLVETESFIYCEPGIRG